MRVALFVTCLADALFPQAAIATVTLLERLGHVVVFPAGQTCCGQMHTNTGYLREAAALVRHHVDVFDDADYDVAVADSQVPAEIRRSCARLHPPSGRMVHADLS